MAASGQLWVVNSLGGFLSNKAFSEKIRVAAQPTMLFRRHVDAEMEKGEVAGGDTVLFDKIKNVTTAGSSLSETSTIPKTEFKIVQDSVVIKEFGNSVPFTEKLSVISKISVPELTRIALTNDMAKVLDSVAAAQFTSTTWKAVCETTASTVFSTNGTAGTSAVANPSDKNLRDIVDTMKKANTPKFGDGKYRAILATNAIRGLYDFFESKANFTTLGIATSGLVGQYYGETNAAFRKAA